MTRVRFKHMRTAPSRWSSGRVHRYEYDPLNREWWPICRPGRTYTGAWDVGAATPLTCRLCIRALRPPD